MPDQAICTSDNFLYAPVALKSRINSQLQRVGCTSNIWHTKGQVSNILGIGSVVMDNGADFVLYLPLFCDILQLLCQSWCGLSLWSVVVAGDVSKIAEWCCQSSI